MPINISCLNDDTQLVEDLKYLVADLGYGAIEEGRNYREQKKNASLENIYNTLRKGGVEIDLQTLGTIYKEVLTDASQFMTPDQVDRSALAEWNRSKNNAAMLTPKISRSEIGKNAPEVNIGIRIANTFRKAHVVDTETKSIQKKMEDIIWNVSKRKLDLPEKDKPKTDEGWQVLMGKVLERDNLGVRTVTGEVNNLQDLWNAAIEEAYNMLGSMEEHINDHDEGDPATIDKFERMIKGLNSAAMKIFFSTGEAKKVLDGILIDAGYSKTVKRDGEDVVVKDWTKLAGDTENVADLRDHARKVLTGKFRPDVVDAIVDSLEDDFVREKGKVIERQAANPKGMAREAVRNVWKDANMMKFLGNDPDTGKPYKIKDWMNNQIEEGGIENVQQLQKKVDELMPKKFSLPVKREIKKNIAKFFADSYPKVAAGEAQRAIESLGIQAPKAVDASPKAALIKEGVNMVKDAMANAPAEGKKQAGLDAVDAAMKHIEGKWDTKNWGAFPEAKIRRQLTNPARMTALDWIKKNDIKNSADLDAALEKEFSGRNAITQASMDAIKKEMNRILNLKQRAANELAKREKIIARAESRQKTSLKLPRSKTEKLAELHNLDAFDGQHERLINNIIGLSDFEQKDQDDIAAISKLSAMLYNRIHADYGVGAEMFTSVPGAELQDRLNAITARNANNKTYFGKIIKGIDTFKDAYLLSLLEGPFTVMRNIISGRRERKFLPRVAAALGGVPQEAITMGTATDKELARNIFKDIGTDNGPTYGPHQSDFVTDINFLRKVPGLDWNTDKSLTQNLVSNAKALPWAPAKYGLSAKDAANKISLSNQYFRVIVYQALTKHGGMSKQEALEFMNESLYGQSLEDARNQSRIFLNWLLGPENVTENKVNRFADDIVKINLTTNGALTMEMVKAAALSAYKVAGYGLGHEANNAISKMISGYRSIYRKTKNNLIRNKEWEKLDILNVGNMVLEGFGLRFMGGGTNWIFLGGQTTGAPILTVGGMSALSYGLRKTKLLKHGFSADRQLDFDDPEKFEASAADKWISLGKLARGMMGIGRAAMLFLLGYMISKYLMGSQEEKDEAAKMESDLQALQAEKEITTRPEWKQALDTAIARMSHNHDSLMAKNYWEDAINNNPLAARAFRTIAPDLLLLHFNMHESGNFMGALKYISNTTGMQFSPVTKFNDAYEMERRGDENGMRGALGQMAGDRLGVPLWRPGTDYFQLAQWAVGKKYPAPMYQKPQGFLDGMLGGGALQTLGLTNQNPAITLLPGIGTKAYEVFKAQGITNMKDLQSHPNWALMRDKYGNTVLGPAQRKKAMDAYKLFAAQTWGDSTPPKK